MNLYIIFIWEQFDPWYKISFGYNSKKQKTEKISKEITPSYGKIIDNTISNTTEWLIIEETCLVRLLNAS